MVRYSFRTLTHFTFELMAAELALGMCSFEMHRAGTSSDVHLGGAELELKRAQPKILDT